MRPAPLCLLLLASACTSKAVGPAELAAEYAADPKEHYPDLTAATKKWLPPDVFEAEPLPEVEGAVCVQAETRAERLRFTCSNAAGKSRTVLFLREAGALRVAETSRALRLLRKATSAEDAYTAAAHGAEIDPEETLFDLPVARRLVGRVFTARRARERLEEARPFAERALSRADLPAKERAALLLGRARLQLTAARALAEPEARGLVERAVADAAQALALDSSLEKQVAFVLDERSRFAPQDDLHWLAGELRHQSELYAAAADPALQESVGKRAHRLSSALLGEGCGKIEEWQAQFESADGAHLTLRVPSGPDFAITLSPKEPLGPGLLEVAGALKPGACVLFSGEIDSCEKSASEAEAVRAPKFAVAFDDLRSCPELQAATSAPERPG